MKRENYLTIQGFMIKDLHLKGNELLVYALIYGFSQEEHCKFTGSLSYIAEWISSSNQTVINTLKSLIEKGLIIKEQKTVNNILVNEYKVFTELKENIEPQKEKKEKKQKEFTPPTIEEVKEYFESRNLLESTAQRFYDYYTAGCWKDGKGNRIKNWKQKVIAVWDKPENRKKTEENIRIEEKRTEENERLNYWLKNSNKLKELNTGKLILVNIPNMLLKYKDKEKFASNILEIMTCSILTDQELKEIKEFLETRI